MFKWLKNQAEKRQNAKNLYMLATSHAGNTEFYSSYQVSDSIEGRYEMLCIHIFLLLERLRHEDKEKQLSELITELLVKDLELNYFESEIKNLDRADKINQRIGGFYNRSADYQSALRQSRRDLLEQSVTKHVFNDLNNYDERAKYLANYIFAAHNYLNSIPFRDIESAKFLFVEP